MLEDTQVTREELLGQSIPANVVEAVEALTKLDNLLYEENLQRVASNKIAPGVNIADMLSNLADSPTKNQIRKCARGLLLLLV